MPDAVGDRRIVEFHRQISPFGGHFHQRPVVAPHEGTAAVGGQIVIQLALAAPHTFETPESFEVRPPDVGNQAEIGLGDRTEQGDFAAGARPHLHHAQLRVARHRQQRKGYADMVVEIALRGVDRVFFGQHAAHQLLGRGLAVAADDRQQRNAEPATMLARQRLQGRQRVVYRHDPSGISFSGRRRDRRIVDDGAGRTGIERRQGEAVAVETVAPEGEEDRPFTCPPRVGRDGGVSLEQRIETLRSEPFVFVQLSIVIHRLSDILLALVELHLVDILLDVLLLAARADHQHVPPYRRRCTPSTRSRRPPCLRAAR